MAIPHEHDINIGSIFSGLYVQRLYKIPLYENDMIYTDILRYMELVLRDAGIVTFKWENLDKFNRDYFLSEERKHDVKTTFFLWHKPHIEGVSTHEPYSFDVVQYNSACVFAYDATNQHKSFLFRLFFGLKISFTQLLEIYDFLDYQLKKNFKNDKDKYFDFLENVLMEHHKLIDVGKIEKTKKYIALYVKSFPKKKKEKVEFYTWKGKYDLLKTVYRKLKENGCIEESTNVYSFLFVFSGKPASAEKKPIQWLKSNRLLAYLLFQLFIKEQIENKDWQSIAEKGNCFANKNGKQITANDLAQAASDFMKFQEKPQESELIDSILDF